MQPPEVLTLKSQNVRLPLQRHPPGNGGLHPPRADWTRTETRGYFLSGPANAVRRSLGNILGVHQFICFHPQSLAGVLELHSSCLPCGRPWVQSLTPPEPKAAEVIQPHMGGGGCIFTYFSWNIITLAPMARWPKDQLSSIKQATEKVCKNVALCINSTFLVWKFFFNKTMFMLTCNKIIIVTLSYKCSF